MDHTYTRRVICPHKELYLKKLLVTFVKELSNVRGVTLRDETSKERLEWLVETHLLMDARTKKESSVIFCELLVFLLSAASLVICNALKFGNRYL